jgi:hypothetical protein
VSALPRFVPFFLAALACVSLGPTPRAGGGPPGSCADGRAGGRWELLGGSGQMHGRLVDAATGQVFSTIHATITEIPGPCLSCIVGTIEGVLDDGVGSMPEYLVRGTFSGLFFSGAGRFQARVFPIAGGPSVGGIHGTFDDQPSDGVPGRFLARWQVCP